MKARRQAAILQLVEHEAITSQDQLRRRLRSRGFRVTQATLSRDIAELGLLKRSGDGAYQRPEHGDAAGGERAGHVLQRALREYLIGLEVVQQLLVLKTAPGHAQLVALAIDHADLPGVAGTIAGDDTILVVARSARHGKQVGARLQALTKGMKP